MVLCQIIYECMLGLLLRASLVPDLTAFEELIDTICQGNYI